MGLFDNLEFDEEKLKLSSGLRLVAYTDGLTEAINSLEKEFEKEFVSLCISKTNLNPGEFVEAVEASLLKHVGGEKKFLEDDVALVAIDIY